MAKPIILITSPESAGELEALQKAHVKGYTRSDGTFVKEHDTSVTAKPKAEGFGRGDKVKVHKPGQISHGVEGTVIGSSKVKQDHVSIKTLDGKLVSHHKDDLVPAVARPEKSASDQYGHPNVVGHAENLKGGDASKPLHHSDLKEGDELIGPDGEKHEYSHTKRGLGRMQIETSAGYSHPTEKDGSLPGWKKTGRNNKAGEGH